MPQENSTTSKKTRKKPKKREDFTEVTDLLNRRLDSLARILGIGNCAAITIINGKIYIAVNELSKHTDQSHHNTRISFIKKVMHYLQNLAQTSQQPPQNDDNDNIKRKKKREDIFKAICSNAHICAEWGTKNKDQQAYISQLTETALKNYDVLIGERKKHASNERRNTKNIPALLALHYRDLIKVENSLRDNKKNKSPLRDIFLKKNAFEIIRDEKINNVHAEAQLIGFLIKHYAKKLPKREIYIGITKLCCQDCQALLDAVNTELSKKSAFKINNTDGYPSFKTRGTHGLGFSWKIPDIFKPGFDACLANKEQSAASTQYKKDIFYRIGHQTRLNQAARNKEQDDIEAKKYVIQFANNSPISDESSNDDNIELASKKQDIQLMAIRVAIAKNIIFSEDFGRYYKEVNDLKSARNFVDRLSTSLGESENNIIETILDQHLNEIFHEPNLIRWISLINNKNKIREKSPTFFQTDQPSTKKQKTHNESKIEESKNKAKNPLFDLK
jgi:hypothetical protein